PTHVLIEKIDLDLGSGTWQHTLEQLATNLSKALEPVIKSRIVPGDQEADSETRYLLLTEEQKAFDVFVYFLTTGRLPWYALTTAEWLQQDDIWLNKLSTILTADAGYRQKLLSLFKRQAEALTRLFRQYSIDFIKQLAVILFQAEASDLYSKVGIVVDQIRRMSVETFAKENWTTEEGAAHIPTADLTNNDLTLLVEKLLLLVCLRAGGTKLLDDNAILKKITVLILSGELKASSTASISALVQIIEKAIQVADYKLITPKDKPVATADDTVKDDPVTGGAYVNQAGLVILHPFLEYFFKDFGLLHNNDFVDLSARQLAVHLLHYLGTGNVNAFEYDLYFEKFLCGWPIDEPLERQIEIPRRMLDEGDNMLSTVIKYWKSLRNTSPDGLREGFLMRKGKLIEAENPARLIVEKMDLDILLSTLPWGIGVIKLPWMDEPFYVEWQ
ncbi:MAG TPA: contractile injection system tape measure protein, partial [Mucilaginibacter sp.]